MALRLRGKGKKRGFDQSRAAERSAHVFYFLPLPEQNVAKHNAVEGAVVKRGFDQSRAAERSAHVFIFTAT